MSTYNKDIQFACGSNGRLRISHGCLRSLVDKARAVRAAERSLLCLSRIVTTCPLVRAEIDVEVADSEFADRVYAALLNIPQKAGTIPITRQFLEKLRNESFAHHALMEKLAIGAASSD